jgi:thioester reductase-like protein
LTGATGSLGAHILAQIVDRKDIHKVYCLVRGLNPKERLKESMHKRGLLAVWETKVIAWSSDLSRPDLGLSEEQIRTLEKATHIIHSAWTVNFNLGFQAFEENIKGVHNLIQLSLSVKNPRPARFFLCSSISVALGTLSPAVIPEGPVDISQCSAGGYGRSKFVAEEIVQKASKEFGADTHILRVGQIVGDAKLGLWNDTEAVPLIIRSALTLKVLPELKMPCSWLPVDTLASAILDLTFKDKSQLVYNLCSPHTFDWTTSFLPALQAAGLDFTLVSFETWLDKLKTNAQGGEQEDLARNPAIKLVDYFERAYGKGSPLQGIVFEIAAAEDASPSLKGSPELIEQGYIKKFLKSWQKTWGI